MTQTDRPGPETWLAARLAAGRPAETWNPVPQIDGCAFSGYEVSDQGRGRSLDRTGRNGQPVQGQDLSTRPRKDGYIQADFYCDDPAACKRRGRHTFTMQKVVLNTFAGARRRGMQGSHLQGNPEWNWFPEAVAWEGQPANEGRKENRPPPPEPTHPCKNAPACPNLVIHERRRCLDCVAEVKRQAAAMLDQGMRLPDVAASFGNTERWIWQLAVEGGYKGTLEQARSQRPPLAGWRRKAARLLGVA